MRLYIKPDVYSEIDKRSWEEVQYDTWHISAYGYVERSVWPKKTEALHRIVWLLYNESIPKGMVVDHINQNKLDNRISNLRLMDKSGNAHNTNKNKGYHWSKYHKSWNARSTVDGKTKSRYFRTEDEARSWYNNQKLFALQKKRVNYLI